MVNMSMKMQLKMGMMMKMSIVIKMQLQLKKMCQHKDVTQAGFTCPPGGNLFDGSPPASDNLPMWIFKNSVQTKAVDLYSFGHVARIPFPSFRNYTVTIEGGGKIRN